MEDEALKLSNQLCFPLYACARKVMRLYTPILEPLDLTYTQYITLLALWETDGISVKALGERLYLDSGTLTPLLKKLETQGYVERRRNTGDERVVEVFLTAKGSALKADVREVPGKVASCITLPMKDAMDLHRILHAILADDCSAESD